VTLKPFLHARVTQRQFGGRQADYEAIHEFMDWPKSAHPDIRFRAIFHHSMGPYILEKVFGSQIKNSDGKEVSVRDIVEQHIIDDLGFIPTVSKWLDGMPFYDWAAGVRTTTKHLQFTSSNKADSLDDMLENMRRLRKESETHAAD